jgi:Fe(3+) dicitrate transport protein
MRCGNEAGVRGSGTRRALRFGWALGAALAAASIAPAAFAEEPEPESPSAPAEATPPSDEAEPADDAQTVQMPRLTVVGSPEAVFELPGSGAFIDAAEMDEQSYDDVNQVLRWVPGVYVRPEDGFGLFPNLSLRGVDTTRTSKVTVMEDGVLAAPAPYASPAAYYRPTVGRMSGLEVLKGSSQIRYGPHTTGGVINYLSTPIPDERAGFLRGLYGSENEWRTHGHWGDTLETDLGVFGYLIEGYARESGGFKTIDSAPNFVDRGETGFTLVEPMLKLSFAPKTERAQRFEFKFGYTNLDADETYLGLSDSDFSDDPYRRYSASRFDNIESEHFRGHLRHTIDAGWGINLTTTAYAAHFERNWFKLNDLRGVERFGGAPGSTVNMDLAAALAGANGGYGLDVLRGEREGTLRVRNNDREYYLRGVESVANRAFETGPLAHDLTLGLRLHSDQESRDQQDEMYRQDDTGRIVSRTLGPKGGAGDRWEQTNALALFIEDTIAWKGFTFRPGFRFEQLWLEYDDNLAGEQDEGTLSVWAPGLGITYDVAPEWMLLGGVYRGFSVPGPLDHLTAGIEEETSIASELGVRYLAEEGDLEATLIGFYTAFDDLIVIDNVGGAGSGVSENVGKVDSYGVEMGVRFDLGANQGWGFRNPYFVNFTYTRAVLDGDSQSLDPESIFSGGEDGNEVPYIPEFLVNFGTSVEFERWGLSATASWVTETFTTASNTTRQLNPDGVPDARFGTTDSYFLLDLAGHFVVRDGVKLISGVQNVTDAEYISSRHPYGPRAGQPRFFYGGLELEF